MAGLVAARVVADHFAEVLLVDHDQGPDGPGPRRGTPQDRHVHILLAGGQQALDGLFARMTAELAATVTPFDLTEEMLWLSPLGWVPRFRCGILLYPCSRHPLEWRVRERVRALPQVCLVQERTVTGLLFDSGRVTGVRMRPSARRDDIGWEVHADLVIDASGRGSRAPGWLRDLGFEPPDDEVIDAHLKYATLIFDGAPRLPDGLRAALIQSSPPASTRGGVVLPIEGDRTLATLLARGSDEAPTDEQAFRAFAGTLRHPAIQQAIEGLRAQGPVANSRATQNRLRHFERVTPWPDDFVVLGDAVCAPNPVYQQGMTTAARGGVLLGELLRQREGATLIGMASEFQRALARLNATPWLLATGQDLRVRGVDAAPQRWSTKLRHGYIRRVGRAATRPQVRRTLLEVLHLLRPPRALLSGAVLRAVIADASRRAIFPPDVQKI